MLAREVCVTSTRSSGSWTGVSGWWLSEGGAATSTRSSGSVKALRRWWVSEWVLIASAFLNLSSWRSCCCNHKASLVLSASEKCFASVELRATIDLVAMGLIGCSSCANVSVSNVVGVMSLSSLGQKSIYILECERLLLCCLRRFPWIVVHQTHGCGRLSHFFVCGL